MEVRLTKLSDVRHIVRVERRDGTTDAVELDSRSFLRHDLAHLAVELELGLDDGLWGSVARGGSLDGAGLDGEQLALAEALAGPIQTIMRVEAGPEAIRGVLDRVVPAAASDELAVRLHERLRRLRGHWKATPYGEDMVLTWPEAG